MYLQITSHVYIDNVTLYTVCLITTWPLCILYPCHLFVHDDSLIQLHISHNQPNSSVGIFSKTWSLQTNKQSADHATPSNCFIVEMHFGALLHRRIEINNVKVMKESALYCTCIWTLDNLLALDLIYDHNFNRMFLFYCYV